MAGMRPEFGAMRTWTVTAGWPTACAWAAFPNANGMRAATSADGRQVNVVAIVVTPSCRFGTHAGPCTLITREKCAARMRWLKQGRTRDAGRANLFTETLQKFLE